VSTRGLDAPKSSIHRALATLVDVGFAEQERPGGCYRLGFELVRLAFGYHEQSDEQALVEPALEALPNRFGETAHYARLDVAEIVYIAKLTPPVNGVRMTSVIGGRNPAHCTGVGKALLAHALPDHAAVAHRTPLSALLDGVDEMRTLLADRLAEPRRRVLAAD
jgi:IclR family transcriptional regulator, acetate operon repressor